MAKGTPHRGGRKEVHPYREPTARQRRYLGTLANDLGVKPRRVRTRRGASKAIERLLELKAARKRS